MFSKDAHFAKRSVLAVAYAATIGGIGSLVGSPPNEIAAKFLGEQGIPLDFLEWMLMSLPFVILSLLFIWCMLLLTPSQLEKIKFEFKSKPFTKEQKQVGVIFLITAVGWLTTKLSGLSASTIALIPVISLLAFGLLNDTDLKQISWPTLLLFGGGLSLGSAVNSAGIDVFFASWIQQSLSDIPLFLSLLVIVFFGILVTMVASNTASAVILIPLMLPLSDVLGLDMKSIAILVAVGVSLDFMMPVGTPPTAIAYSTGVFNVREMIKNGFLINLGTGILLVLLYYFFYL